MEETDKLAIIEVERPDDALFNESRDMLALAKDWEIETPEMAVAAADDLRQVKVLYKELEEKRTAITKPLLAAKKEVDALFKPAKDWLNQAERLLKAEILEYQQREARIARAAQERANKIAAEAKAEAEAKAAKALKKGKVEKAAILQEEAERTVAPVIETAAPKLEGVSVRKVWKARVTDKQAFIRHVLDARLDLLTLVTIDQGGLNALARIHKNELNLEGVKAEEESSVAARA